jgi:hypothetical protein
VHRTRHPQQLGQGIPAIFLVGPDGKTVATDLRGQRIRTAVAQVLNVR